ncbi:hypothetical protein D3C73_993800 [compost metagenome]
MRNVSANGINSNLFAGIFITYQSTLICIIEYLDGDYIFAFFDQLCWDGIFSGLGVIGVAHQLTVDISEILITNTVEVEYEVISYPILRNIKTCSKPNCSV